ncbi:MAG: hypothetical protein NTY19_39865 [Planctomycetota bacterium]|nr:hypothetical protein [Planctomycetota bacterium]
MERTLEVTAEAAQRFAVTFPLDVVLDGEFASFTGPDKARTLYDTVRGSAKTETFPVAMVRTSTSVFGVVADSPGLWENRWQVLLELAGVHGLPTAEVDALLAERIAREIVHVPAFNESISTVSGQPHGQIKQPRRAAGNNLPNLM